MPMRVSCVCGKEFHLASGHGGKPTKCSACGRTIQPPPIPSTGYDVFVSYSSLDRSTADAICSALERNGLRCWIAPRDITPGSEWGEAIVDGISQSRVMVLIFSAHSNRSPQVSREVERGVNKGLVIVPFRIDDISMSRSLEYFLSSCHWLDALTPPLEAHTQLLVRTILAILDKCAESTTLGGPRHRTATTQKRTRSRLLVPLAGTTLAVGVIASLLVAWHALQEAEDEMALTPTESVTSERIQQGLSGDTLEEQSDDPLRPAQLLIEQARNEQDETRRDELWTQARGFLEAESKTQQTHMDELAPKLAKQGDLAAAELERLRTEDLQTRLLYAAALEESVETYPLGSDAREQMLRRSADEYCRVFEAYPTVVGGLYARLYYGRCLQKLGQTDDAAVIYENLLNSLPDAPEAFRTLKARASELRDSAFKD